MAAEKQMRRDFARMECTMEQVGVALGLATLGGFSMSEGSGFLENLSAIAHAKNEHGEAWRKASTMGEKYRAYLRFLLWKSETSTRSVWTVES